MMKISVPLGLTQDEQVLFLKDKTHGQLMKLTAIPRFFFNNTPRIFTFRIVLNILLI